MFYDEEDENPKIFVRSQKKAFLKWNLLISKS